MSQFSDDQLQQQALQQSDWYLKLVEDYQRLDQLAKQKYIEDPVKAKATRTEVYRTVEAALKKDLIPLATDGPNLDQERRPIDTIVIHHSKNQPGMSLDRLNAMHLLRLYSPSQSIKSNPKPIWSNHFRNGRPVFWGYHWFIRQDGQAERLLEDNQIGWHAGCWHVNTRSIGICIDDDLTQKSPDKTVLEAIGKLIQQNYQGIPDYLIIGHCEVRHATPCPGDKFFSDWKPALLKIYQNTTS